MESTENLRKILKSSLWERWMNKETDERRGIPSPSPQKPAPQDAPLIDLVAPEDFTVGKTPLVDVIKNRKTRRQYAEEPLSIEELSFLLWATQGVRGLGRSDFFPHCTFRTVPSGGARHPFETYLFVNRVDGLQTGLYRYLPLEHKLCLLSAGMTLEAVDNAIWANNVKSSAVIFVWTVIPYRTEWRYGPVFVKTCAIDAGHLCQNLYLACEGIGAGTCAIAGYDQDMMDNVLGVDGKDEFTIYVASVGKSR